MTSLTLLLAINGAIMYPFSRAASYTQLSSIVAVAVVYPKDGPPPAVETMPVTHMKPTVPFTSALVVLYSHSPSRGKYDFFVDEPELMDKRTKEDATCYGTCAVLERESANLYGGDWVSSFVMREYNTKVKFGCILYNGPQCDNSSDKILPLLNTCGYLHLKNWDKVTRSFKCWDVANFHYEVHQNRTRGC